MKEHTIRLLKECNAGCKMAVSSMEQVRDFVQDDKLAGVIDDYKGRHEKLERESSALLESCGEKEKEPRKLASNCLCP